MILSPYLLQLLSQNQPECLSVLRFPVNFSRLSIKFNFITSSGHGQNETRSCQTIIQVTLVPDRALVLLQNLKQQASAVCVYLSSLVFQGLIRMSEQTHYSIQWLF